MLSKDADGTANDMRYLERAGLVENVGEEWRSTDLALKIVVQFSSQIRLSHSLRAKN